MKDNFKGILHGKTVRNFRGLDKDIKPEDRLSYIENKLGNGEFFTEYFDQGKPHPHFNVHPTSGSVHDKKSALTEDNTVCNALESMASFLIYGSERDKHEEKRRRRIREGKEPDSIDRLREQGLTDNEIGKVIPAVINGLTEKQFNARLNKVRREMLERAKVKEPMIQELEDEIDSLSPLVKELKDFKHKNFYDKLIYSQLCDILGDTRFTYEELKTSTFDITDLGESSQDRYDPIDIATGQLYFTDQEHMLIWLNLLPSLSRYRDDQRTEIYHMLLIFDKLEAQVTLTELEKEVLRYRQYTDLADHQIVFDLSVKFKKNFERRYVNTTMKNIARKYTDAYMEDYTDWYYLNFVKNEYKTCSDCGETYPANESYFHKNPDGKLGLHVKCKKCR